MGQSEYTEASRMFFNAGLELTDSIELYAFGNYSDSEGDGSFFYRYPYNGTIEKLREQDGSTYFPPAIPWRFHTAIFW